MDISILTVVAIVIKGLLLMSIIYNGIQLVTRLILSLSSIQNIHEKYISGLAFAIALYYIINNVT